MNPSTTSLASSENPGAVTWIILAVILVVGVLVGAGTLAIVSMAPPQVASPTATPAPAPAAAPAAQ